jgi:hypothetical protein
MTYNAFEGETWDVDNLTWFNGWLITKANKITTVKMAHTLHQGKATKCVVVLYDDISTKHKENIGKYVLIGPEKWFMTKELAEVALQIPKPKEKTPKTKDYKNGKDNRNRSEKDV